MVRKLNYKKARRNLLRDLFFILVGAVIAIIATEAGLIRSLVDLVGNEVLASFAAGLFFTSSFTVAPAAVALASIHGSVLTVCFWGALGAMFGDIILFFFIRDRFAEDIKASIRPSVTRHVLASFHFGFLKWLAPVVGALIIASPLPDEFGLTLLGLSKVRLAFLMPIAFAMNFLGIYSILWFANVI